MAHPGRVIYGNPYRWRGSDKLLDTNTEILDARTPERQAEIEGHLRYFSWENHTIRVRKSQSKPGDE